MNRLALLLLTGAALGLAGCNSDAYSPAIKYAVRTDPLVLDDKLGDKDNPGGEFYDPDPPGVLPILSAKDVLDPRNPMHFSGETLFPNKLRDPRLLSKSDRNLIEDFLSKVFG